VTTENENAGERFLASARNDNACHLESFGYAQDKLGERSFFTPFFKGAVKDTKDLENKNSSNFVLLSLKVFAAGANFPVVILTISVQKRIHRRDAEYTEKDFRRKLRTPRLCGREKKSPAAHGRSVYIGGY
jgi:hypothetical protein